MKCENSSDPAFTDQRGSILIGGLLLVFAVTLMGLGLYQAAVVETSQLQSTKEDVNVLYAAETGLNRVALDVAWDDIGIFKYCGLKSCPELTPPVTGTLNTNNTTPSSLAGYGSTCFGSTTCDSSDHPRSPAYLVQAKNDADPNRFWLISTACVPGPVPDPGAAIATCPAGTKAMAQVKAWIQRGTPTVTTTETSTTTTTVLPAMPWALFGGASNCGDNGCVYLHPGDTSSYNSHKTGCTVPCAQSATNTGNLGSIASNGNMKVQGGTDAAYPGGPAGINGNLVSYTDTVSSPDLTLSGTINGSATAGGTISGTATGGVQPGKPTTQTPLPDLPNCANPSYTALSLYDAATNPTGNVISVSGATLAGLYNQSTGALTISGTKTLTLRAGKTFNYCFGTVAMSSGGVLNIDKLPSEPPVTDPYGVNPYTTPIYIDGTLHIQNNDTMVNNALQDPQLVQLIVTYGNNIDRNGNTVNENSGPGFCGGAGVCLESNSTMYMTLYAPSTGVQLQGGGDVYGAIVGKTINISGNSNIHFDEFLLASPNLVQGIPTARTITTTSTETRTTFADGSPTVTGWQRPNCRQTSLSSPWSCS